jgi:quercetin 2,3-dioxygenase
MNTSPILDTAPLGLHWPTMDPFLFCAHHLDRYPAGNGRFGPQASLQGRNIGADFEERDGWRMYHGQTVPGFPQHPHRGFETVTFVRQGFIDHADSLGATARFGTGDAQWLTAGRGIVHAEMFPLLDTTHPNPAELFQIWLNLPRQDKMVDPYFTMLWSGALATPVLLDDNGRRIDITVIAGRYNNSTSATPPPPDSWAARDDADVGIWQVVLSPSARWVLPKAAAGTTRMLYFFEGDSLVIGGQPLRSSTGALVRCDTDVVVEADGGGASCLVLQGRPIGEPVAQHGPFVMNDRAGIEQAFADYQRTEFGGWPWSANDPINGPEARRFAKHPGGRLEQPSG